MHIVAQGLTHVGRVRDHNEDSFLVDPELGLYAVCDGMGGHAAGDLASATAIDTLRAHIGAHWQSIERVLAGHDAVHDAATVMREAIEAASLQIHALGEDDRKRRGMGTTCTALLVLGSRAIMGHVGDSRLYLTRDGRIFQLSEDHTFVQEAVRRGMMTKEDAEQSPHANVVTRAVGPSPKVLVDILTFDILPGDTLLLCSDGLHNYFRDPAELLGHLGAPEVEGACDPLIATANARGGEDNITTVVLRAASAEDADSEWATQVTNDLSALSHILIFHELDMKELCKVASAFVERRFDAGDPVVEEAEQTETLFLILDGSAEVSRNDQVLARLGAGDHFGEMALLSRRPRSATVTCREATRILALDRDRFYALMQEDAVLAAKVLWKLAQTLSLRLDALYAESERVDDHKPPRTSRDTISAGLFPNPFTPR